MSWTDFLTPSNILMMTVVVVGLITIVWIMRNKDRFQALFLPKIQIVSSKKLKLLCKTVSTLQLQDKYMILRSMLGYDIIIKTSVCGDGGSIILSVKIPTRSEG